MGMYKHIGFSDENEEEEALEHVFLENDPDYKSGMAPFEDNVEETMDYN